MTTGITSLNVYEHNGCLCIDLHRGGPVVEVVTIKPMGPWVGGNHDIEALWDDLRAAVRQHDGDEQYAAQTSNSTTSPDVGDTKGG